MSEHTRTGLLVGGAASDRRRCDADSPAGRTGEQAISAPIPFSGRSTYMYIISHQERKVKYFFFFCTYKIFINNILCIFLLFAFSVFIFCIYPRCLDSGPFRRDFVAGSGRNDISDTHSGRWGSAGPSGWSGTGPSFTRGCGHLPQPAIPGFYSTARASATAPPGEPTAAQDQ